MKLEEHSITSDSELKTSPYLQILNTFTGLPFKETKNGNAELITSKLIGPETICYRFGAKLPITIPEGLRLNWAEKIFEGIEQKKIGENIIYTISLTKHANAIAKLETEFERQANYYRFLFTKCAKEFHSIEDTTQRFFSNFKSKMPLANHRLYAYPYKNHFFGELFYKAFKNYSSLVILSVSQENKIKSTILIKKYLKLIYQVYDYIIYSAEHKLDLEFRVSFSYSLYELLSGFGGFILKLSELGIHTQLFSSFEFLSLQLITHVHVIKLDLDYCRQLITLGWAFLENKDNELGEGESKIRFKIRLKTLELCIHLKEKNLSYYDNVILDLENSTSYTALGIYFVISNNTRNIVELFESILRSGTVVEKAKTIKRIETLQKLLEIKPHHYERFSKEDFLFLVASNVAYQKARQFFIDSLEKLIKTYKPTIKIRRSDEFLAPRRRNSEPSSSRTLWTLKSVGRSKSAGSLLEARKYPLKNSTDGLTIKAMLAEELIKILPLPASQAALAVLARGIIGKDHVQEGVSKSTQTEYKLPVDTTHSMKVHTKKGSYRFFGRKVSDGKDQTLVFRIFRQ
jgi:hypothetical protein